MDTLAAVLATFAAGWFARSVTRARRVHARAIRALRTAVHTLRKGQGNLSSLREFERLVPRLEIDVVDLKEQLFGDPNDEPSVRSSRTRLLH